MAKRDFYETLGVTRSASSEDLKKAFRKLAMQCHPDRNPGDTKAEQRFKEINEAYDVLKDEQRRAAYDRFGHAAFENGGARGGGEFGSGFGAGSRPISCPTCHGQGRVRAQQGFFTSERTCPACHGAGRVIENPCRQCGGQGRVHRERALAVSIPAGVEDGTRIRLAGEGEAGVRGGSAGDLYIFLTIKPHRLFHRDGTHIHVHVPVSLSTAALGGALEVPTIDGSRARVTIPAGTQNGHQLRLKGKGMSTLRSTARGDMYVEVRVETPVHLSRRQQELLKEFDAAGDARKTQPEAEGFFAKVKEFFGDLTE